jgi:hypothetical protein
MIKLLFPLALLAARASNPLADCGQPKRGEGGEAADGARFVGASLSKAAALATLRERHGEVSLR